MKVIIIATLTWTSLWLTPDQAGQCSFNNSEFTTAAAGIISIYACNI